MGKRVNSREREMRSEKAIKVKRLGKVLGEKEGRAVVAYWKEKGNLVGLENEISSRVSDRPEGEDQR